MTFILGSKRGYLQIEFIFIVFFYLIFFTMFYVINNDFFDSMDYKEEQIYLDATAQDICQMLTQFEGKPVDWDANMSEMSSVGLYDLDSKGLDENKVNSFFYEGNYPYIMRSLNVPVILYVEKIDSSGNIIRSVGEQGLDRFKSRGSSQCFARLGDENYLINVEVWR